MRTARELRMLRSGKGYFSMRAIADAMVEKGCKITPQSYCNKENGKSKFSPPEIKALSEIFDMTLEEAFEAFS